MGIEIKAPACQADVLTTTISLTSKFRYYTQLVKQTHLISSEYHGGFVEKSWIDFANNEHVRAANKLVVNKRYSHECVLVVMPINALSHTRYRGRFNALKRMLDTPLKQNTSWCYINI